MKTHNTTQYRFDAMYAVCEFGGHLDLEYQYIYANGLLLARYDKSSPDTHYYHHDGLGSIIGLTDGSMFSPVEQSYFYDEFGNELGSWGSVSNHYLYTGQEYDGSISNLYNLRARLYDVRIGRFTSEDAVIHSTFQFKFLNSYYLFPQNNDPFLYCLNNSINYVDPMGLFTWHYYKNWGGPGWSGGQKIDDLNALDPNDPKDKGIILGLKPPADPVDRCYMIHDYCYADCRLRWGKYNPRRMACQKICDWELSLCLAGNMPRTPIKSWPKTIIARRLFSRGFP
jgi:RHS repeat-associated protein